MCDKLWHFVASVMSHSYFMSFAYEWDYGTPTVTISDYSVTSDALLFALDACELRMQTNCEV